MAKDIDYKVIKAAKATGGAVTAQALAQAGVSGTSIRRRVARGDLVSPFKGIYIVSALETADSAVFAALQAYPEGALCRFSAASRLGFDVTAPARPEIVVRQGSSLKAPGIQFRETRSLPAVDVSLVRGMRATTPARTLCDISWRVKPARLRHILETQLTRATPDSGELVACIRSRRRRGVAGVGRMAEILAFMLDDEPIGQSVLEMQLARGLAAVGLTGITRQFRPPWYDGIRGIVDMADPVGRTIIEADGRRFRQVTQAHDNDRQRDRTAAAHGYVVLRVGYQEFVSRRDTVLAEIKEVVLSRRTLALGDSVGVRSPNRLGTPTEPG